MALSRTANNVLVMDAINIASGNNLISFSPNNPVMISNSLIGLKFADGSQQTTATSINSAFITANSAFTKANNALANTTGTFAGSLTVTENVVLSGPTNGLVFSDGSQQTVAGASPGFALAAAIILG